MLQRIILGYLIFSNQKENDLNCSHDAENEIEIVNSEDFNMDKTKNVDKEKTTVTPLCDTFESANDLTINRFSNTLNSSTNNRTTNDDTLADREDQNIIETQSDVFSCTTKDGKQMRRTSLWYLNKDQIWERAYLCLKCRKRRSQIVKYDKNTFNYKFPIQIFNKFDENELYYLCVFLLPSYKELRFIVRTKKSNWNHVDVKFLSSWLSDNIFSSKIVMYFKKRKGTEDHKNFKFFNFQLYKHPSNNANKLSCFGIKKTKKERDLKSNMPKCVYNSKIRQYVLKDKRNGIFRLNRKVKKEYIFLIRYMPVLFCLSNLFFFESYKDVYLEKIRDFPDSSKKLYLALYGSILHHQGMSFRSIASETCLHLCNILEDILKNFDIYKYSEKFSKEVRYVERHLNYINDNNILDDFKCHLLNLSPSSKFGLRKFESCYRCLIAIWEFLFKIDF